LLNIKTRTKIYPLKDNFDDLYRVVKGRLLMGGMEVLFIVVAAISIIVSAFILIKFRNIKFSLIAGLAAVAIILGLVLFAADNPKDDGDDVMKNTPTQSATSVASPTATAGATPESTKDASSDIILTAAPTVKPTATPVPTTYKTPQPEEPVNPEAGKNSVIYLTFDDGPSKRTPEVLDILKRYNIKATFFIINFDDSQIPILQRIIDEGHSIGIHGYSHEYGDIYKSEAAFMENVTKLRKKLNDKLGYDTTIMRFPGGSSNRVSANYSTGIMTKLVVTVQNEGYQYFDWNVDSRDAERFDAAGILDSVKKNTKGTRKTNIVLMHDNGDKHDTVKALPNVIEWAKANGYSFSNLNAYSETVHHGVYN